MSAFESLFKKPAIPQKRKSDTDETPASRKSAKVNTFKTSSTAYVTDEIDEENNSNVVVTHTDGATMPELDEELEDEEGGRFFGGGITTREKEILDFIDDDEQETQHAGDLDETWLRKFALSFEKKISKNSELRAKFEDEPFKFMESEAELDAEIKGVAVLTEKPELFHGFNELGCVNSLVGLLAHDNIDISIDVVQVISELTDDDVEATPDQWNTLVTGLLNAQLLEMLISNITRFKESNEQDRQGVYLTLNIIENLCSVQELSERIVKETKIMLWLLERMQATESPISQNKQYCSEILAILAQMSAQNRRAAVEVDAIDVLLQLLNPYRRRDPVDENEEEFAENLFDALACIVEEGDGKTKFVEAEGTELCLLMLKDGKMSKARALKILDHAVGGPEARIVCERLVEAQGLKIIFSMFMKKNDAKTIELLLGIFASLLRHLPADSGLRIRLLAKFMEKDYEKTKKILSLRRSYQSNDTDRDRWCLQIVDVILAWICAEDDGAHALINEIIKEGSGSLEDIIQSLQDILKGMEVSGDDDEVSRDMLETLISCISSR